MKIAYCSILLMSIHSLHGMQPNIINIKSINGFLDIESHTLSDEKFCTYEQGFIRCFNDQLSGIRPRIYYKHEIVKKEGLLNCFEDQLLETRPKVYYKHEIIKKDTLKTKNPIPKKKRNRKRKPKATATFSNAITPYVSASPDPETLKSEPTRAYYKHEIVKKDTFTPIPKKKRQRRHKPKATATFSDAITPYVSALPNPETLKSEPIEPKQTYHERVWQATKILMVKYKVKTPPLLKEKLSEECYTINSQKIYGTLYDKNKNPIYWGYSCGTKRLIILPKLPSYSSSSDEEDLHDGTLSVEISVANSESFESSSSSIE